MRDSSLTVHVDTSRNQLTDVSARTPDPSLEPNTQIQKEWWE
jgi:hypothetical protein